MKKVSRLLSLVLILALIVGSLPAVTPVSATGSLSSSQITTIAAGYNHTVAIWTAWRWHDHHEKPSLYKLARIQK